ncbi:hypothetical protein P40081_28015 [Paenibacillus sp. FSL P4-0081]|uniref:hypothetical protein n=1 Tax=Paenibacillus sp. FSL P4-0081 TaxID=1536769 RepID=UPI0004F750DD|nr:hypothetical protein [Paenibacillus sp. FSL P4-0081]AIQ31564.1 hypothetical protein P40081_28015 [Paenibacillus sp. FSL P4-0081]
MNNIRGKLDGKIILVIGESIVDVLINRFLEEGASVIAVNNSRKETADPLYIKNKLNLLSIDITNPNDIDSLMVKWTEHLVGWI